MTAIEDLILNQKHLSIIQTARLMTVSRRTVYNWIKARKVEWFRAPNGRIRVLVHSLGTFKPNDEILYR